MFGVSDCVAGAYKMSMFPANEPHIVPPKMFPVHGWEFDEVICWKGTNAYRQPPA